MTAQQPSGQRNTGAVAVNQGGSGKKWLVPALLALALIIALVVALILLNQNDEGDDKDLDVRDDPTTTVPDFAPDVGPVLDGYQLVLN